MTNHQFNNARNTHAKQWSDATKYERLMADHLARYHYRYDGEYLYALPAQGYGHRQLPYKFHSYTSAVEYLIPIIGEDFGDEYRAIVKAFQAGR